AVVRPNHPRQDVLLEQPREYRSHQLLARRAQPLAPQQIPAEAVRYRQWVAVHPVARLELTLEIRRPHCIRGVHLAQRWAGVIESRSPAPLAHQPRALQQLATRRPRRQLPRWMALPENRQQLPGSPTRMPPPQLFQCFGHSPRRGVWRVVRPPRALHQARRTRFRESPSPFIARLPADLEALADLRERQLVPLNRSNKTNPFPHG